MSVHPNNATAPALIDGPRQTDAPPAMSDHALAIALRDVLEARAANIEQGRLIFNATRVDGVGSLIAAIQALPVGAEHKRPLLHLCHDLLVLNTDEGEYERQAAGVLDHAVTVLRDSASNGGQRSPFAVKALARTLRPALGVIAACQEHDAMEFVAAVRQVDRVLAAMHRDQLLTPSIRNQLGPNRYELLERLVDEREEAIA